MSPHVDLERVLDHVSTAQLYPELVIVYSRLGRHAAALQLLVFNLSDLPAAFAYCGRLGPAGGEALGKLAGMLLDPPGGGPPRLMEAALVACYPRATVEARDIIDRLDGEQPLA